MLTPLLLLLLAASSAPHQKAETPSPVKDKVVCKRLEETGSLVGSTKVCHTVREWAALRDNARQQAGEMMSNPSGPNMGK